MLLPQLQIKNQLKFKFEERRRKREECEAQDPEKIYKCLDNILVDEIYLYLNGSINLTRGGVFVSGEYSSCEKIQNNELHLDPEGFFTHVGEIHFIKRILRIHDNIRRTYITEQYHGSKNHMIYEEILSWSDGQRADLIKVPDAETIWRNYQAGLEELASLKD